MSMEILGQRIAALRKQRGIRQEQLAEAMSISAQAVSKWENGGLPDVELLPRLASYFQVSLDYLFGRNLTDYTDLKRELAEKIRSVDENERMKLALEYCWTTEKALYNFSEDTPEIGSLDSVTQEYGKYHQRLYSSIVTDSGFTRMGLCGPLQYFLIVPEPEDAEAAYMDGTDYPALFRALSDEDVFRAIVRLSQRDRNIGFTARGWKRH